MYENPKICAKCGGKCCASYAGVCLPSDFGEPLDRNRLRDALESGKYSIDWWEGDFEGMEETPYFVRPATVHGQGRLLDPTFGGPCVFWKQGAGCSLAADARPAGCRLLEPRKGDKCHVHGADKESAIRAWRPHNALLESIITELGRDRGRLEA